MTVEDLANSFTARELAAKLVAAENAAHHARRRLRIVWDALASIARGEWTAEGAVQTAKAAIRDAKEQS